MNAEEFRLMYEAETYHWWYRGMEIISRKVVEKFYVRSSSFYRWLRGVHDRAVAIAHRYHRQELRQKLEQNGLICEWISYANMFLCPPVIAKRWSERFLPDQKKYRTFLSEAMEPIAFFLLIGSGSMPTDSFPLFFRLDIDGGSP